MDLTDREKDLFQALSATTKSALSFVPGLSQALAGYDAYKKSNFDRNLKKVIASLQDKVNDLSSLFSKEWLQTEEGQQFVRKVLDSAFDAQVEDKQELFVNALINGVNDESVPSLAKLKFIDMLRHLSRASLLVLAQMHSMLISQVRGPGRQVDSTQSYPLVDSSKIAATLSSKFDPYLVTGAISELESQGLFSRTGEWKQRHDGSYIPGGGFATELCYTDFTARFVEFISWDKNKIK